MTDLNGRWALITGASRGIGRLAALFLAKHGCNLVLHGRTIGHCQGVLEKVKALGVEARAVEAELSDFSAIEDMLAQIDRQGTQIDIVLNNAGVQVAYRESFLETPMSDYEQSFLVNTMAPMLICYHYLPQMVERGFGRIVNTTSGIQFEPQQAGYSASKAALNKVTIDLGTKYEGTDVLINLTDPGWCRTDLGGAQAPNAPESAIPGVVVGVFINDGKCGRCFSAQDYRGLTIDSAVEKAERESVSPYDNLFGRASI